MLCSPASSFNSLRIKIEKEQKKLKKNYMVLFIMLFAASIAGGLAFKKFFSYSMIIGAGLGIIFLLCAALFAGKTQKKS